LTATCPSFLQLHVSSSLLALNIFLSTLFPSRISSWAPCFQADYLLEQPVSKHLQSNFFSQNEEPSSRLTNEKGKFILCFNFCVLT
jgi:hypothetical protein